MINSQPNSDRCADIAAALHTLALRFTDLIGSGVPVPYVQLNIQPGCGDDESIVAAVDAVTSALLGHAGRRQYMHDDTWHYNNGDEPEYVGQVGVRIFNGVSPEYVVRQRMIESGLMTQSGNLTDFERRAGVVEPDGAAAKAEEPECTPECDALYTDITKTGGDRQWHHDECPWAKILDGGPKWTFELGGAS